MLNDPKIQELLRKLEENYREAEYYFASLEGEGDIKLSTSEILSHLKTVRTYDILSSYLACLTAAKKKEVLKRDTACMAK